MPLRLQDITQNVQRYVNFLDQYNLLASKRDIKRIQQPGFERAFAKTILHAHRNRRASPRLAGFEFSITKLKASADRELDFVLATDRKLKCRAGVTTFVGHRFTPGVTDTLRHNLQLVLRPYSIPLLYSDTDMPNGPVFETILKRIRESAFCVFDDRETETRPNVFIEIGAAIALGKPYFYFNFRGKHRVRIRRKTETIGIPTNLSGMLHIPYAKSDDVLAEFAMRLPGFLRDRGLATRAPARSARKSRRAPRR